MRSSRVFTYAAGWAVLTVLAAGAVWWGLRPLLAPVLLPQAAPTTAAPPSASPSPAPTPSPQVSKTPVVTPVRTDNPRPTPSLYDGWAFDGTAFTRTFDTTGGRVTVRIAGGRVSMVSSTPNPGYEVTSEQPHAERLVVKFFDGVHFIVVDSMWWENRPYAEVTNVS